MKVSLTQEQGIEILQAQGTPSPHDFQVLKAGLKKLLSVGKNKIVLELTNMEPPTSETLRELAALDLLARELSGRIVLAGIDPELKRKIQSFATPPAIPIYNARKEAVESFSKKSETAAPVPAVPAADKAPTGNSREEILARERGDVGTLRTTISALENQNKALQAQILLYEQDGPSPSATKTDSPHLERIKSLESALETALIEVQKAKEALPKK